ncbi:MAG: MFS transporter [Pseudobutyrivibrio sp.]|nr:MFS transporter [Pseudobutyrivibrio sp.]
MGNNVTVKTESSRKATWLEMITAPAINGNNICMYMCMVYASYIGSEGYGIATALVGVIITFTRVLDAVTDTAIAYIFEKFPAKFGKCRPFTLIGWLIEAAAVYMMYSAAAGHFKGVAGLVIFVAIYVVYIIGYTVNNMAGYVQYAVLTNDPKQRPMLGFISTIYNYGLPIIMNNIVTFNILPKYDNQYNMPMLKEMTTLYIGISLVCALVSLVGIWRHDTEEVWKEASVTVSQKNQKVGLKEMWEVLSKNKDVQRYIVTCASDKFAQTTATQSVILTLLGGVLIKSYAATQVANNYASAVGLIFAFVGGVIIGKIGAKKGTVWFSWFSIIISAIQIAVCVILGPTGMEKIGDTGSVVFMLWVVCTVGMTAGRMLLSVAAGTMRGDVTDGEEYRSGNFLPSVIAGVYSLFDKGMSSICATVATVAISLVGYVNTVPQMGDKITTPIFVLTVVLSFGLPIIGFVCNLLAMKNYTLDKEQMEIVQEANKKKREAIAADQPVEQA